MRTKEFLTLQQVADRLDCPYRTVLRLVHEGQIRRMRGFRKPMKVSAIELERYIKQSSGVAS